MDLEEGFLADMVAHPHDATPWLVLADWLEERDDPRGELVRLLRLCWDEPRKKAFKSRHARLQELFASGVRLPLPRFTNSLGMEFVWVPPGTFWRGGGNGKPGTRKVEMKKPFWLGVFPVTQGQWQTLRGTNPSYFARTGGGAEQVGEIAAAELDRFPVENVSWNDAQAFLMDLNAQEQETGWTYRLPTADEWEYACRWPVTCCEDCGFSFHAGEPSSTLSSDRANFNGTYPAGTQTGANLGRPTPVGSYPANRLGIHDLHGNVWEWTESCGSGRIARKGRMLRGGSYYCAGLNCAVAFRTAKEPGDQSRDWGFRLARVSSER
jgi:uncharacterized protein (TIGR02996 family)